MKKTSITPEQFKTLLDYSDKLTELPSNWDEHGALAVDGSAIRRAKRLLHTLNELDMLKGFGNNEPIYHPIDEETKEDILNQIKQTKDPTEKRDLLNCIVPGISYSVLSIYPTKAGGLELNWGCDIGLVDIRIPPESSIKIEYKSGYVDADADPPKYIETDHGKTNDYGLLAKIVEESIFPCF